MTARTSGAFGNLRVVEGAFRDIPAPRLGALAQFFDIGHCVLSHLSADIRVGRFRERAFLLGGAEGFGLDGDMARLPADGEQGATVCLPRPPSSGPGA